MRRQVRSWQLLFALLLLAPRPSYPYPRPSLFSGRAAPVKTLPKPSAEPLPPAISSTAVNSASSQAVPSSSSASSYKKMLSPLIETPKFVPTPPELASRVSALRIAYGLGEKVEEVVRLLNSYSGEVTLTAGERKLVCVAALQTKSVATVNLVLNHFAANGVLDSELMYTVIHTANKNSLCDVAYDVLLKTLDLDIVIDIETVNGVINNLARHGRVKESWEILSKIISIGEGSGSVNNSNLRCDMDSYLTIISCAARLQDRDIMMKAFFHLESSMESIDADDESIFITALSVCSFSGDFVSAHSLFNLYKRFHGVVEIRAYSLLLMAYVEHAKKRPADTPGGGASDEEVDAILGFLLESKVDRSPAISNLVFRQYCLRRLLPQAHAYLERMRQLKHCPGATGCIEYSALLCELRDFAKGREFRDYLLGERCLPPTDLLQLLEGEASKETGE